MWAYLKESQNSRSLAQDSSRIPQLTNNCLNNHCKGPMKLKGFPRKCVRIHRTQLEHPWAGEYRQTASCPCLFWVSLECLAPRHCPKLLFTECCLCAWQVAESIASTVPTTPQDGYSFIYFTKRRQWIQEGNHHLHKCGNRVSGRLLFNVMC